MPPRLRRAAALAAAVVSTLVLSGCGSSDDWSRPHATPSAIGALGAGYVDPTAMPTPEATITPRPGSWDDVRPSPGLRVVLLTAGDDTPTRTLVSAVKEWAGSEDVSLKTVVVANPRRAFDTIDDVIAMSPDLVVTAGNQLVDPLTTVTAHHLDQQFLVLGAELAEPTANVTAASWTGASYRGEGLAMSSPYEPASFTTDRSARAVRAGIAAVLNDLTGIVVWLD